MPASETVACPLCETHESRLLYEGDGFAVGRCRGCGLIRQNPRMPASAMRRKRYARSGAGPRPRRIGARDEDCLASWETQHGLAYERGVAAVEHVRADEEPKGLWFDVGAGTGALLLAARARGWRVAGVEPREDAARVCRETHGMEVAPATFDEATVADGSAEVVSLRHVLEHLHEPAAAVDRAHRMLCATGLLLVEVPNFDGLRYRGGRARAVLHLGRPFWESLNLPEHLYYFTIRTLGLLLDRAGFEIAHRSTYGKTRLRRGPLRRLYDGARDRLRVGNKIRVVARKKVRCAT